MKDSGIALQVSDQFNEKLIKETLMLAQKRYGQRIRITGTEEFKASVLIVAVTNKMNIEFTDPEIENLRKQLNFEINGEVDDQRAGRVGHHDRDFERTRNSERRIL